MNERLMVGLITVALGCGFLNSVAMIKHKVQDHNRVPFGDVEEIVIPTKKKLMYEYFKENCKALYPPNHYGRYMTCTEIRMGQYIRKLNDVSLD